MANKLRLGFSTDQNIYLTKDEDCYAVRIRDWKRLKKQVDKIKSRTDWWSILASVSAGIAGSAFVSWLVTPFDNIKVNITKVILLCISLCLTVISIVLFITSKKSQSVYNQEVDEVTDTINEIEENFNIPSNVE